jgi:TolB protein
MKRIIVLAISLIIAGISYADQSITIIGGNNVATPPIAILNFANDGNSVNNVANIIGNDLNITGETKAVNLSESTQIDTKTSYIVDGTVDGSKISYTLKLNNESATVVLQNTVNNTNNNIRQAAHTISNQIYQKLTNNQGIFLSKIAYTVKDGKHYKIIISDYDGFNQKTIVSTKSALASLTWSPNGAQIAYVSFEPNKPVIYVQDIYKTGRYIVAGFSGSNYSPAFTPDGRQLVVTLTKDEGSQLYLIDNAKYSNQSYAKPIFKNDFSTINTEPDVSNDEALIFTSDHDGGPQIFSTNLNGGNPKRLTFNLGNYNTTARFSHDGKKITFVRRDSGSLRTYLLDTVSKTSYPISLGTTLDISPSFAPNDKLVLFSSNNNIMYIVNATGTTQTQLNAINYDEIIDQKWANNF